MSGDNQDILIRFRLDDSNALGGFKKLKSAAEDVDAVLGSMADTGPISEKVKAIGQAIKGGAVEIEAKYARLAAQLEKVKQLRAGLADPGKDGDSKERAKYEADNAKFKNQEASLLARMDAVTKSANRMMGNFAKFNQIGLSEGGEKIAKQQPIAGFIGGGYEAAMDALIKAMRMEEAARRKAASKVSGEEDMSKFLSADQKSKSKIKAQQEVGGEAQRAREQHDKDVLAGQMLAAKLQIKMDNDARKKKEAQDKADEKQAMKDAKQAMTPQVAADQMNAEKKAVEAALSAQAKLIRDHNNKVQGLDGFIERGKKELADREAEIARRRAVYASHLDNLKNAEGMRDAVTAELQNKLNAKMAERAAIHDKQNAKLAALKVEHARVDGGLVAAQRAKQEEIANLKGSIGTTAPRTPQERAALALIQEKIILAERESLQISEAGRSAAAAANAKLDVIYRKKLDATNAVVQAESDLREAVTKGKELVFEANKPLRYWAGHVAKAEGEAKKLADKISEAWAKSEEAKKGFVALAAAAQDGVEKAKRDAAAGADQRKILMSAANMNRAEKLVGKPEEDAKKAADQAFADNLSKAAIERQIMAAKAKIEAFDKQIRDAVAASKPSGKQQQAIPVGLTDQQMRQLQLSQLRDLEAELKAEAARRKSNPTTDDRFARLAGRRNLVTMPEGGSGGTLANAAQNATLASVAGGMSAQLKTGLLENLAQKVGQIVARTKELAAPITKANEAFEKLGATVTHAVDKAAFGLWKVQGAVRLVTGVWQQFMDVLSKGEAILRVEYAFESMTRGAGANIEELRQATGNMMTDESLMRLANFGVASKITGDEMELLAKRATGAALITGKSTEEMTRRFVEGIAKQEREIMDEATVIMTNASQIWNAEGKRLGKKASDLTAVEKQRAYMKDFIKQSAHLDAIAANFPGRLGAIGRAQTTMANAWNSLWAQISSVFAKSGALEGMTGFIGKVTSKLEELGNSDSSLTWARDFGSVMTEASRAVLSAGMALSPMAKLLPVIGDAIRSLNGPLATSVNLWARYQTLKMGGLGVGLGVLTMGAGSALGMADRLLGGGTNAGKIGEDLFGAGQSSVGSGAEAIASSLGLDSASQATRITAKGQAQIAAAEEAKMSGQFQTSATNATEYAKALSYLYSERKRADDYAAAQKGKPTIADDGTNFQNALKATQLGVQGLLDQNNLVDVQGAMAGMVSMKWQKNAFSAKIDRQQRRQESVIPGNYEEIKTEYENILRNQELIREYKIKIQDILGDDPTGPEMFDPKKKAEAKMYEDGIATLNASLLASLGKINAYKDNIALAGETAHQLKIEADAAREEAVAARTSQEGLFKTISGVTEADVAQLSQPLYEKSMVTIPGRLQDKMSIKDWIGSRSTIKAGPVREYGPENRMGKAVISQDEIVDLADELTLNPSRKKGATKKEELYKQEAVKYNLEAFRRMEVELLDEQFKMANAKKAAYDAFSKQSEQIIVDFANAAAQDFISQGKIGDAEALKATVANKWFLGSAGLLAALPEGVAQGAALAVGQVKGQTDAAIKVIEDKTQAELDQARAMIKELEKRLATKGGRSKEAKMILPELLDIAESFTKEAMGDTGALLHNMNKDGLSGNFKTGTERLSKGFSRRLGMETAEAYARNIQVELTPDMVERVREVVDKNQETSVKLLEQAMGASNSESFGKMYERILAADQAVEASGALAYHEDSAGMKRSMDARKAYLEYEKESWDNFKKLQDIARESAIEAKDSAWEYSKIKMEMSAETESHINNMTRDSFFARGTGYETQAIVDAGDIPDWIRRATQDPLMGLKKEEFDRQKEAIIKERDQRLQELKDAHDASGAVGATNMGAYWEAQKSIKDTADSQLSTVGAQFSQAQLAETRAASEKYYQEVLKPWENASVDLMSMFGEGLAYGVHDMWVSMANDALDHTENMIAMFERMTGAIGGMLQETASATIAAYTGSPLLGKVSGGLIKGTWDAIMGLFKKKEKRKDEQNKRAERELRRKESKKADQFTVVLVNNGLSVNRDTARQVGQAVNAYVNGGGKLKSVR